MGSPLSGPRAASLSVKAKSSGSRPGWRSGSTWSSWTPSPEAASVRRDIEAALPLLAGDGLLAFHDYPDPGWPGVRRVVDEYAARFGWLRIAQADFLGIFRTAP